MSTDFSSLVFKRCRTADAIWLRLLLELKSNSSVNCSTRHPSAAQPLTYHSVWNCSHSKLQSIISEIQARRELPPPLGLAGVEGTCIESVAFGILSQIDKSFNAEPHFSELVNGLVNMSAACRTVGPWTNLYHFLPNCSSSHERLTLWVLSICLKAGDLPDSKIRIVAWLSSTNTPSTDLGANKVMS